MFVELLLGALAFLLVWDYFFKKRRNDMLKKYNITGPKTFPIIGSAHMLKGINTENMMARAKALKEKHGKIYRVWVLHQLTVVILDGKYLEAIFNSQQLIKKSVMYGFMVPWLGTGLLLSTGKKWHSRRKIITPTFHFKILEQFVEVFDQQSGVLVKKLYEKADGKTEINIFPIICLTALDIIAETAMGVKVHAQENPEIEYVQALSVVAHIMAERFLNPTERTELLFRLTSPKKHKELYELIKVMHDFTNNVIQERRAALDKSIADGSYKTTESTEGDVGAKKRMALLDVLLQSSVAGSPLSDEDIREEVDTFMFEGHDTTTSGIAFCLYLIARHADVQSKLFEEICQVIGEDKHAPVTYRQLQELKIMECAIKESLRLYPSVPAIGREATEDVVLGDIILPANTNVSLSLFLILRDPDYFPDPDSFKPERFMEDGAKINQFVYTPFSAGPRNCIGQKFAMLEMKSTISKILRHFELLPLGPEVRPMVNLIMRSANGTHLGLKPRSYKNLT